MIQEDYVSFETAKLLKEKGFNEPCLMCYNSDKKLDNYGHYYSCKNSDVFALTAPTLQMVMKWLRELHNIVISIFPTIETDMIVREDYIYIIYKNKTSVYQNCSINYEQSAKAAIKYCLEKIDLDSEKYENTI